MVAGIFLYAVREYIVRKHGYIFWTINENVTKKVFSITLRENGAKGSKIKVLRDFYTKKWNAEKL